MIRKSWPFWLGGLFVGWAFDFLFWKKVPGISFLIWITLILLAGVTLLAIEKVKPSWKSILLMVSALAMAFFFALRAEPFTRFVTFLITFGLLFLLTFSYQKGYWIGYRIKDYFVAFFQMIGGMFSRGFGLLTHRKSTPPDLPKKGEDSVPKNSKRKTAGSILLGIGITVPILAVLMALLASADLAFASQLQKIIESLHLEKLPEWILRLVYIVILADLLVGLWLHAGFPRKPENPDTGKQAIKPFLGWLASIIPLISIVILFAVFVGLQLQYLFGAQSNINAAGFTYAEYARRGFVELLVTAVITLGLDLLFSNISVRNGKIQEWVFNGLRIAILLLTLVILASSIQRLMLYENAYGFSRIRTYSHIFIYWLGGLITATIALVLFQKTRYFGLAVIITIAGFGTTLAGMNVDGFIARQNIQRARAGLELDPVYLGMLSEDGIPSMVTEFQSGNLPQEVRDIIGSDLSCRLKQAQETGKLPWQSLHFGLASAFSALSSASDELKEYPISQKDGYDTVLVGNKDYPCYFVSGMD